MAMVVIGMHLRQKLTKDDEVSACAVSAEATMLRREAEYGA